MDLDEFTFNGPGANGNATPVISAASATPAAGAAPLKVDFTASATDPEGTALSYEWDFGVAGAAKATTKDASYTYTQRGIYTATLTVKDADGRAATRTFTRRGPGHLPGHRPVHGHHAGPHGLADDRPRGRGQLQGRERRAEDQRRRR